MAGAVVLAAIGVAFFEKNSATDWIIGIGALLVTGSLLAGSVSNLESEWKETHALIKRLSRTARCRSCGKPSPEVMPRCGYCGQREWQIDLEPDHENTRGNTR